MDVGQQVQNYIVEADLGAGGMGRVYRVRHAILGTTHALKVLDPSFRSRSEVRERFLGEARIGAMLAHPNVVRVTDIVNTPDVAGLVMELVEGHNLEDFIHKLARPATAQQIRAIFGPVLSAVGEAHRKGIIHRDLKPANVLLGPGDVPAIVKVSDFGIAKVTDAAVQAIGKKQPTREDAKMGTLSYMSPEAIRSVKDVTPRSDVFSLGATLYELATGKMAFGGDSDFDVMKKIVDGDITPPATLAPELDPMIAAAITKALASDPKARFATCDEFADALRVPVAAKVVPEPPREPAADVAPARRGGAMVTGVLASAALLAAVAAIVLALDARSAARRPAAAAARGPLIASDGGVPAAPLAPSDDPNDLSSRLSALETVVADVPNQIRAAVYVGNPLVLLPVPVGKSGTEVCLATAAQTCIGMKVYQLSEGETFLPNCNTRYKASRQCGELGHEMTGTRTDSNGRASNTVWCFAAEQYPGAYCLSM